MARTSRRGNAAKAAGPTVWNVALYIRLSREDGNAESMSVTNQKARLMQYLQTDFVGEYRLADVFIDDGISGTTFDRQAFQRMKEGILDGKINCVIVKDISRLGRNSSECGYYLGHFFVECGTRFISLDLPAVDSYLEPQQMNSIALDFMNIVNEDFARQTSQKIRGTFHQKRSEGKFIGSSAPYGYKKDPSDKNSLIIDEEAAQTVREIYKMYVCDGVSKRGIMMKLNSLGVPCPTEYKRANGSRYQNPQAAGRKNLLWSEITISGILKNQMYLGHMVQGKQRVKSYKVKKREMMAPEDWYIVENTHEPIIERDMFDAAQKLGQRDIKAPQGKNTVHLFSGFLKCADCGRAMTRRSSKGYTYYSCRTYTDAEKGGSEPCKKHSIRLDRLESAVLAALRLQIWLAANLPETIAQTRASWCGDEKLSRLEAMLKARRHELDKHQGLCDALYPDMKSGLLSPEEYHRLKAAYAEKLNHGQAAIQKIEEEIKAFGSAAQNGCPDFERFVRHRNISALDRNLLVTLIDTVHVHEGGDITICMACTDQYMRVLDTVGGQ